MQELSDVGELQLISWRIFPATVAQGALHAQVPVHSCILKLFATDQLRPGP